MAYPEQWISHARNHAFLVIVEQVTLSSENLMGITDLKVTYDPSEALRSIALSWELYLWVVITPTVADISVGIPVSIMKSTSPSPQFCIWAEIQIADGHPMNPR
jgi:hypothetical protein